MDRPVRVALLGHGTVGSAVVRLLTGRAAGLRDRIGAPVDLVGIAVLEPARHAGPWRHLLTTDAAALVDADVDVVVELIGGVEPARELVLSALRSGKSVVTANKALVARHGLELRAAAESSGAALRYEGAVAGAVPVLRPLRESLAGDRITRVSGIVNGTCNFVLTTMTRTGGCYRDALAEAVRLGYAEADPTADIEGHDAAAKAALLAFAAFGAVVDPGEVRRTGIAEVTAEDIAAAQASGRVVKPIAVCERVDGQVNVAVHPAMVRADHPLAVVDGVLNAVLVEAEAAGELLFRGAGAGGDATASAVLGDLVSVARDLAAGVTRPADAAPVALPVDPRGGTATGYHVRVEVDDRPGVPVEVGAVFAGQGVEPESLSRRGSHVVVTTRPAPDPAVLSALDKLAVLPEVRALPRALRLEG
ncbi:homoserine dehydrogenase [Saccharothrix australiensis]|uniref:homoserine dehydrogenase n=1 Tax=Saccharothrix australiensis TaxID=2072 RepID=UPI003CCC5728